MPLLGTVATVAGGFLASASRGALSFLSIVPKYVLLIPAIVIVWTALIGGTVESLIITLPLTDQTIDLQTPTDYFANVIATIIDIMPFMQPVLTVFFWGFQIKMLLIVVGIIKWILSLFVQS